MKRHKEHIPERRKYVRLETVFPIEFQLYSREKGEAISTLRQGFTRNVSEGGMCLEVNNLENGFIHKLQMPGTELELYINIPPHKGPIKARAGLRWAKKVKEDFPNRYLMGVEYVRIPDNVRKLIIGYARILRRRPKIIVATILSLIALSGLLLWQVHEIGLKKGITEKQLLSLEKKLVQAHEKRLALENRIWTLNMKWQQLDEDLLNSKQKIGSLETRLRETASVGKELSDELISQRMAVEKNLDYWQNECKLLTGQLEELSVSKEKINKELTELRKLSGARIVRVRLTNGNRVIGQLLDFSRERLDLKVGLGTIGIERTMIASIKEVSGAEKIDIQKEWLRQEDEARRLQAKRKELVATQHAKGYVYFNGRWIKENEARRIQEELKKKEAEVFELIAKYRLASLPTEKERDILEALLQKRVKPIVSIKDRRLYVNGRLFFIKGVGYGIEYPGTPGSLQTFKKVPISVFEKDFQMMKEAGINTIRTYEPLPSKLLDLAEKYGIMVIENVCYPSDNTDFGSRVHLGMFKEQIRRYVSRDKHRKCILMWSIWNDAPWAWGSSGNVVQRYGSEKVNGFLKELYDTVKQYDTTHPVTAGNATEIKGESVGWDFLDVIGLNVYIGGHDWFLEEDAKRQIAIIKGIEEKYDKPVVILETGFSTFIEGQDQAEVLEKQIKTVGTNFSGITIFQWADGWQKAGDKDKQDEHIEEHWGILDGYRNPKPGYRVVCKLFNAIPTDSYGYSENTDESR